MPKKFVLLLTIAANSFAFQFFDHKKITRQAVQEFVACFPETRDLLNYDALIRGNLNEDLDLINKELFYSHYYNPFKDIKMFRSDSAGRVRDLEPQLEQASYRRVTASELSRLGHAIHHFQDMAVPSHVVPVKHSFFDGFERLKVDGEISSRWSCEDLRNHSSTSLSHILHSTAVQTIENIENARLEVRAVIDGNLNSISADGGAFWIQAPGDDFGEYGFLGNHFGQNHFWHDGAEYNVPENFATEFKRQQMRLAVRSTLKALAWLLVPQLGRTCQPELEMAL